MANSEEKVSKFVQAITQYAQEQKEKIHQEVEDFKTAKLQEAEQQVLRDAYSLIQKERLELQGDMSREMSRRDLAARKELLALRRDMMSRVFAEAEIQLAAFRASPAVGPQDTELLPQRRELCPQGCPVQVADDIRLGGIRGVNLSAGRMADNTLDTRLEEQKDWFITHAGLTVD